MVSLERSSDLSDETFKISLSAEIYDEKTAENYRNCFRCRKYIYMYILKQCINYNIFKFNSAKTNFNMATTRFNLTCTKFELHTKLSYKK